MAKATITSPNIDFTLGDTLTINFSNADNNYLKLNLQLDGGLKDIRVATEIGQVSTYEYTFTSDEEAIMAYDMLTTTSATLYFEVLSFSDASYTTYVGTDTDETSHVYINQTTDKPVFTSADLKNVDLNVVVKDSYNNTVITSSTETLLGSSDGCIKGYSTLKAVIDETNFMDTQRYTYPSLYRLTSASRYNEASGSGVATSNASDDQVTIDINGFFIGGPTDILSDGDSIYFKPLRTGVGVYTYGDMPDPLVEGTEYFVIVVDSVHIKLATTYANAIAGTAINITEYGTMEFESPYDVQLTKVADDALSVSATDARGLTTTISASIGVFTEYFDISAWGMTAVRTNNVDEETTLSFSGLQWVGYFGGGTTGVENDLVTEYRYKETTSATWSSWNSITPTVDGSGNISFSDTISGDLGASGFDDEKSFNIEVRLYDRLSVTIVSATLSKGIPLMDFTTDGVAVKAQYDSTEGGSFQVDGSKFTPLEVRDWILSGWVPFTGTLTFSSVATYTNTNTTKSGVVTQSGGQTIEEGMKIWFQNNSTDVMGIVTDVTGTNITIFTGTDYTLVNSAITEVYLSSSKSPRGFPMDKAKWSVILSSTADARQSAFTDNVWYNEFTIALPVGKCEVYSQAYLHLYAGTGIAYAQKSYYCISTANNSASDSDMIAGIELRDSIILAGSVSFSKILDIATATNYYLNIMGVTASTASGRKTGVRGDIQTTKAIFNYLY